jgi:ATP-dependent DNA ligase
MPLGRKPKPFDHSDWIFELKYDGFRALPWWNTASAFSFRAMVTRSRPSQTLQHG